MAHLTKVVLFLAKQRFDAGSLSYSPESEFLGASSQLFLWRVGKQTVEGGEENHRQAVGEGKFDCKRKD